MNVGSTISRRLVVFARSETTGDNPSPCNYFRQINTFNTPAAEFIAMMLSFQAYAPHSQMPSSPTREMIDAQELAASKLMDPILLSNRTLADKLAAIRKYCDGTDTSRPEIREKFIREGALPIWAVDVRHNYYVEVYANLSGQGTSQKSAFSFGYVPKPKTISLLNCTPVYFAARGTMVGVTWDEARKKSLSSLMTGKTYSKHVQDASAPWRMVEPLGIVIHCTEGSNAGSAIFTLEQNGLAVHFIAEQDGTIYQGEPLDAAGMHARGCPLTFGIEMVGFKKMLNSNPKKFHKMIDAAARLSLWLEQEYPSTRGHVGSHSEANDPASAFHRRVYIGNGKISDHSDPGESVMDYFSARRQKLKAEYGVSW